MNADDLDSAVQLSVAALHEVTDLDWDLPVAGEWTAHHAVAHVAHALMLYSGQIADGRPDAPLPFGLSITPGAPPVDCVAVLGAAGGVLSAVLRCAPTTRLAFHPCGTSDPGGFAALGCAELLLHTYDIRVGFGRPWTFPFLLSQGVLERLVPDVATTSDPTLRLLWATGRYVDPELGRRARWRWDSRVRPA